MTTTIDQTTINTTKNEAEISGDSGVAVTDRMIARDREVSDSNRIDSSMNAQSVDLENLSAHADHVGGEEGHPEFGQLKVNFSMPDADFIEDGFVDSKEEVAAAVASLEEFSEEVASAINEDAGQNRADETADEDMNAHIGETGEDVETFELGPDENAGAIAQENDASLIRDTEDLVAVMENIPDKMAFKIGEAADLVGVKQYVLRYWETEFEQLHPKKSKNNQRVYSRRDVETALMIKKLLYTDRFSIEGARSALRNLKNQVKEEKEIKTLANVFDNACLRVSDLLADIRRAREVIEAQ